MHVQVDLSVIPLGVGISLSPYVAACERILRAANLNARLHAFGTNIEGDWEEVFAAVRACHEELHRMGAPRVTTSIRMGTRTDRVQHLDDKLRSVEEKLQDTATRGGDGPSAASLDQP